MTRSQRLHPLLRHADAKRDEAAQALAEKQRALEAAQQRLKELHRYVAEYAPAAGVVAPAFLANRMAFRERIEQAVGQQTQVVAAGNASCELERARLILASRDQKVLEQLADSYRVREAREADKRVQKELDDIAGRGKRTPLDGGQ